MARRRELADFQASTVIKMCINSTIYFEEKGLMWPPSFSTTACIMHTSLFGYSFCNPRMRNLFPDVKDVLQMINISSPPWLNKQSNQQGSNKVLQGGHSASSIKSCLGLCELELHLAGTRSLGFSHGFWITSESACPCTDCVHQSSLHMK